MGLSRARFGVAVGLMAVALLAAAAGCQLIAGLDDPVPPVPKGEGGIDASVDAPVHVDVAQKEDSSKPTRDASTSDGGPDAAEGGSDVDASDGASEATVPILFVQGNAMDFFTADSGSMPVGTTKAGDLLVVNLSYDSTGTPLITDNFGDSYKVALGPVADANDFTHYVEYAENLPSGDLSISVSLSSPASSSFQVYALEYYGLIPSGALDQTAFQNGTMTGLDGMKSGSRTTTAPHELIFGYGESGGANAGTGYILRESFNDNVAEDAVVRKIGNYQTTATMVSGTNWIMIMATFKGY
jgi:hypothetical protein